MTTGWPLQLDLKRLDRESPSRGGSRQNGVKWSRMIDSAWNRRGWHLATPAPKGSAALAQTQSLILPLPFLLHLLLLFLLVSVSFSLSKANAASVIKSHQPRPS
jgi:hypothetical protein